MENTPNTTEETKTLIRIAASFDESGNARAAVDFYGETDPKKQLELLGTLVFEAFTKTDAHARDIFDGKPRAFPGSKSKLSAHLDAEGAHIFSEETEKGTAGELLRCAVDGWLAKNPKYIAEDIASAGLRHAKKSLTERQTTDVLFLSKTAFAIGKTLPRFVRIITAFRLIVSIFFKG
jgi:hypothetical protein